MDHFCLAYFHTEHRGAEPEPYEKFRIRFLAPVCRAYQRPEQLWGHTNTRLYLLQSGSLGDILQLSSTNILTLQGCCS